jgi:hypothetical protein
MRDSSGRAPASQHKALSSNHSTKKKKERKRQGSSIDRALLHTRDFRFFLLLCHVIKVETGLNTFVSWL